MIRRNKLTEEDKTKIYTQMFEYINLQHKDIVSNIEQVRSLCNYVITGMLALVGFSFQNQSIYNQVLETDIRKITLLVGLVFTFSLYFKVFTTVEVSNGFDPIAATSILEQDDIDVDGKTFQRGIMDNAENQYQNAKNKIDNLFKWKNYFILASFVFIIIFLVFTFFKPFSLYV